MCLRFAIRDILTVHSRYLLIVKRVCINWRVMLTLGSFNCYEVRGDCVSEREVVVRTDAGSQSVTALARLCARELRPGELCHASDWTT